MVVTEADASYVTCYQYIDFLFPVLHVSIGSQFLN